MFPKYLVETGGGHERGPLHVPGRGKMEKAEDVRSARQSRAQTQGVSEQMASLVMTARNGQRDSMSLRSKPSTSGLGGITLKTRHYPFHISNNTASFLKPVNKHLCILIFTATRKQSTYEVTTWPSGDSQVITDVYSHRTPNI